MAETNRRAERSRLPNVILTGLPGAGKTSIGKAAAKVLHWPFIDFDTEIERREHATVAQLFERNGEAGFRELESGLTRELAGCRGTVMSVGGGWVTRRGNVALLRPSGRIIYLRASPGVLIERLAVSRVARPLLAVENPLAAMERLFEERRAAYEDADLVIDTEVIGRKELIAEVVRYAASLQPAGDELAPPLRRE